MTENSYAFIVPILNDATWLEYFILHYTPILKEHPDNRLIFVEGTTAFHSPAEHLNYHSIDGSDRIVKSLKTSSIHSLRQGKVYLTSDLLNEGLRVADTQNFIIPLQVSQFLSHETFNEINRIVDGADTIRLHRIKLCKTFKSRFKQQDDAVYVIRNIEGMSFKDGQWIPSINGTYVGDALSEKSTGLEVLDVASIQTRKQCQRNIMLEYQYRSWYHHNVKAIAEYKDVDINSLVSQKTEEIEHSRGEVEFKGALPEVLIDHPWYDAQFDEIWNCALTFPNFSQVKYLSPQVKTEKRMLEIGCATGRVLHRLIPKGWTVKGLEPSLWASGYAKHVFKLEVIVGITDDFTFNQEFDVILMWDTFEHIPQPKQVLLQLSEWLDKDGVLMIYTPDYDLFKKDKRHWLWSPRQHYFLYTPETLNKLLEICGFSVLKLDRDLDGNGFFIVAEKVLEV